MNENAPAPEHRPRQGMDYGETEDVQHVHAAIQREKREPRVGMEPLSIWLIAVYGLAVFFGGAYLGRYAGNFSGEGLDWSADLPTTTAKAGGPEAAGVAQLGPVERGKKVYAANCQVCHQADGNGAAGQGYPPLAGAEWVLGSSRRLGMIVLKGLEGPITVKGAQYGTAVMQAWEKSLSDAKIADVLTYIRQEWGNNAGPVSAEGVGALRKELAGRAASFREPDLKAVPDNAELPGGAAPPAGAAPAPPPGGAPPKP